MPNWCSNTTTVYGSVDDLTKFVEAVKCDERSDEVASDLGSFPEARIFDRLLPFPENGHATTPSGVGNVFAKDDETAGTIDGYQWALDNWGTKWGDCNTRYEVAPQIAGVTGGTHVTFYYDTAWAPANWTQIAKMYPDLTFITKYEESGMGFCGAWAWTKGEDVYDFTVDSNNPIYPEHPAFDEDGDIDDAMYDGYLNAMSDLLSLVESQAEWACGIAPNDVTNRTTNKDMVQRSG
tara:strand:+ start:458 stop:1165 length:708 start_codon:yes stop_codon:yes gene_type:complete